MVKPRIVSLLPSTTEIICALGLETRLKGRSHECDYPDGLENVPVCTHSHIDGEAGSRAIHDAVVSRVNQALSLYDIDMDRIRAARPTHILTQDRCKVCAVDLDQVNAFVSRALDRDVQVVAQSPSTLKEVFDSFLAVGEALDCLHHAETLNSELMQRVNFVTALAHERASHPKVLCLEWLDPFLASGHWIPECVVYAGGRSVLATMGQASPTISFEDIKAADPDKIIAMPCGFSLERAFRESKKLLDDPKWQQLRAVQDDEFYVVDGNQFFNRPGPRIVDSMEILLEIIQPGAHLFGYEDRYWTKAQTTCTA